MEQEEDDCTSSISLFFLYFRELGGFENEAKLQNVGLGSEGSGFGGVSAETGAIYWWSSGKGQGEEDAGISMNKKIKWAEFENNSLNI